MDNNESEVITFTRNELYEKLCNTPTIKLARDLGFPMLRLEKYVKSIRSPSLLWVIGPSSRMGKPCRGRLCRKS